MVKSSSPRSRLAAILAETRDDPCLFARKVIGWNTPGRNALTSYQRAVAAMVSLYRCVVWVAGNSVGKSRLFALLIAWWLLTRKGSKVIVTAPSQHLIGSVIFDELRRLTATARIPLGGTITISPKASPQTWVIAPGWQAVGFSTSTVERGSGQHNPQLLVIVDEGSGIPDYAWEAIHSLNAAKLVVGGNPLCSEGGFVELFGQSRGPSEAGLPPGERTVSVITSSTDSPHAHLKKSPCGLADRSFLDDIARRYGRGSLYWRLHIELDKDNPFPTSSHDQLIPTPWIDRCPTIGTPLGLVNRSLAMAIDVAKGTGRDGTIWMIGDIYGLVHVERSNTISIPDAVDRSIELATDYGIDQHNIVFDAGGWAGSDFRVYLNKRAYYDCRGYRGNDDGGLRFKNQRSRCATRVRQRLDPDRPYGTPPPRPDPYPPGGPQPMWVQPTQPGFSIPMGEWWPELRQELIGLRYSYELKKAALENKEEFAARLKRSPDLSDTLLMLSSCWVWPD